MKESFPHDYHARNDSKLQRLFMHHGVCGIGVYWCVVEMLYEKKGHMLIAEVEKIAFELRVEKELVHKVIFDFKLFNLEGESFSANRVKNRLKDKEKKSMAARNNVLRRWVKPLCDKELIRAYKKPIPPYEPIDNKGVTNTTDVGDVNPINTNDLIPPYEPIDNKEVTNAANVNDKKSNKGTNVNNATSIKNNKLILPYEPVDNKRVTKITDVVDVSPSKDNKLIPPYKKTIPPYEVLENKELNSDAKNNDTENLSKLKEERKEKEVTRKRKERSKLVDQYILEELVIKEKEINKEKENKPTLVNNSIKPEKKLRNIIPPPKKELVKYIQENHYPVDPAMFYNFYESKGWVVGKVRMIDWQAAVRTWVQKRKTETPGESIPPPPPRKDVSTTDAEARGILEHLKGKRIGKE